MKKSNKIQLAIYSKQLTIVNSHCAVSILPIANCKYRIQLFFMLIANCLLLLQSCASKTATKEEHHEEQTSTSVTLTDEQMKAIALETGFITNKNLKTTLKVNGKLVLPPQNQAQVSLLVGGIVKNILVKEGAFVRQGVALATIENIEFIQMQQDFLQSSSSLLYLKAEFERQKSF